MPTLSTSDIPKPSNWDEFEDIVWNIYRRKWQDPNASRNGRQGQRQNGVDIYGQPKRLGDKYSGVQCKRLADGTLTTTIVENETVKAEEFIPKLTEFTIATTDNRDSNLQEDVRKINSKRIKQNKFPIFIVFWQDLCNDLTRPDNHDLLRSFYSDWQRVFGDIVGSDSLLTIETQFSLYSSRYLKRIETKIPGIADPIPREEVGWIKDQLIENKPVLLVGEAGTGKSGIASFLSSDANDEGMVNLLIDARSIANITNETQLRDHFGLTSSLLLAIKHIGSHKGCRLVIDQLDNIAGMPSAILLIELAIECSQFEGLEVVVISRLRESHEQRLLERLTNHAFVQLASHQLSENKAREALGRLGIIDPLKHLLALGCNLLNLRIIGRIKEQEPEFDFSTLLDEVLLWDHYVQILLVQEEIGSQPQSAEQVLAEAVRLAKEGLNNEDRSFCLDFPHKPQQKRLISGGIIECSARICSFYHEKFQDYLYAWDATQRHLMPSIVLEEINVHRTRNVLSWMAKIYARLDAGLHRKFLKETLNV